MSTEVRQVGTGHRTGHNKLEQSFHKKPGQLGKVGMPGSVVYTEPFFDYNPILKPFINPTIGNAMNQNVTFGGTPEIIHNGGTSTEWTGSIVAGTWNFADSGKTTITSANNNDAATFAEETPATIDWDSFTALTGKVDLDTFSAAQHTITIQFDLAGVAVGDALSLNGYINTSDFAEQSFAIPKADFNFATSSVDGFTISIARSGGTKPTIKFDDIQMEETGSPLTFAAAPLTGEVWRVTRVILCAINNITGITTVAGATENATVKNLAYNQFFGETALTTGLTFTVNNSRAPQFSASIKQLSDILGGGGVITDHISDGTNSMISLAIPFEREFILTGDRFDTASITINDDLSGLLGFTAALVGSEEV